MTGVQVQFFKSSAGDRLAYEYLPGNSPSIVFLGGYASDMTGTKAEWLRDYCAMKGQAYLRLDYSGHGQSDGDFAEGTIGRWSRDAMEIIEHSISGDMILVGSSMGGWVMLLNALHLGDRVKALVGIAAAPDFTEDLMWQIFDQGDRDQLLSEGEIRLPSEYDSEGLPLRLTFIEDGRQHLLLREAIEIHCPVRLMQGMLDADVPWKTAFRIMQQVKSGDVEVTLIKDGDHRLSTPENLKRLSSVIDDLLQAP